MEEIHEIFTPPFVVGSFTFDDMTTWGIMRTMPGIIENKIMKKHGLTNCSTVNVIYGGFGFKSDAETGHMIAQMCVNYKLDSDENHIYKFSGRRVIVEATNITDKPATP